MSVFSSHAFDLAVASAQIDEFGLWLSKRRDFTEHEAQGFLRTRPDLAMAIGAAVAAFYPSVHAFEFRLADFRTDLVVGSGSRRRYVFIEFEDGRAGSIFNQTAGSNRHRDWGRRLEHGLGQLIDWAWVRNDQQHSQTTSNVFSSDPISDSYLLICGRSTFLDPTQKHRVQWRFRNTRVGHAEILFWTWDDVPIHTRAFVDALRTHG